MKGSLKRGPARSEVLFPVQIHLHAHRTFEIVWGLVRYRRVPSGKNLVEAGENKDGRAALGCLPPLPLPAPPSAVNGIMSASSPSPQAGHL
jgi:hypothetical protein